jgi:hypothetical protein
MAIAPLVDNTPGLYQVITTANTDYPIAIPAGAKSVLIWFEQSATDSTMIGGRVGFDKDADPIPGITGTDTLLGYQPPLPVEYPLEVGSRVGGIFRQFVTHLHVTSRVAGSVVCGMWSTSK